jgi:hypothetical protein
MDVTTGQPTLMSAARNFIRKSAGTAVLAIVPLAAVSLAPQATGQTMFGTPGLNFSHSGSASLINSFPSGSRFFFSGGTTNNISAMRFGVDGTITTNHISGGNTVYETLVLFTAVTSLDIPGSTIIPISYDFSLNKQVGIAGNVAWSLNAGIAGDGYLSLASGTLTTGSATFTGTANYTTLDVVSSNGLTDLSVYLTFQYITAPTDVLKVTMNSANQGITLNAAAIPEPSTYAVLFGLGALGLVAVRRARPVRAA